MTKSKTEFDGDAMTTIKIRLGTRKRLASKGTMDENYDSVINKLIDLSEARTE